jgi:HAD superfamily hydrolase (TIGR01509 family)
MFQFTYVFDLARVFLFPKQHAYAGELNALFQKAQGKPAAFFESLDFNEELLSYVKQLGQSADCYAYTSGTFQEDPLVAAKLQPVFKEIFSAGNLNLPKSQANSFVTLATKLGKTPQELIFTDDTLANVEAARQAGWQAIQYFDNDQLVRELKVLNPQVPSL